MMTVHVFLFDLYVKGNRLMASDYNRMSTDGIKDLVLEFFVVFSAFEYALKERMYIQNIDNDLDKVTPNWEGFISDIKCYLPAQIDQIPDKEVKKALKYFHRNPPLKQVVRDRALSFMATENHSKLDALNWTSISCFVRRVRNNLFHGEKSPFHPDNGRDRKLLIHSISIIKFLAKFDPELERAFLFKHNQIRLRENF